MKSAVKSNSPLRRLALAAVLAGMGTSVMAQAAPAMPAAPYERGAGQMGKHDPAKMQAMMANHQAELKASLNLTPAQEGAWASYTNAMQPSAKMYARPTPEQRADMDKLTTPQRIDKIREMRSQRMADMNASMNKRGDATKALYAALTPEQQKVFDTQHKSRHGRAGHGGPGQHGHRG